MQGKTKQWSDTAESAILQLPVVHGDHLRINHNIVKSLDHPGIDQDGTLNGIAMPFSISEQSSSDISYPTRPLRVLSCDREMRERSEYASLSVGATLAVGSGHRLRSEEPDPERTCFERDHDRIIHSAAFRRLAGKTQVFIFPEDHQRTRLTHALEVAQVAVSIAKATRLNVELTEAIALGHDCGHGPGGHASEQALSIYLDSGFDHAPWGADVTLSNLNLCTETLDGIRNHSWSRPMPSTPEALVVRWADRCAYCAHDLEDAVAADIVKLDELPDSVSEILGSTRPRQLNVLIGDIVKCIRNEGVVGMSPTTARALAELRKFNYERIYLRDESVKQANAVIKILRSLVEFFIDNPDTLNDVSSKSSHPPIPQASPFVDQKELVNWASVAFVAGMTDKFALKMASRFLGWNEESFPLGIC